MKKPPADLMGKIPNFPEIEPCAHCGAMPTPPGMFMDDQRGIRCSWCDIQSRAKTSKQAIASWNRRAR